MSRAPNRLHARIPTYLRLAALCVAALASVATSPAPFEPPDPDSCDDGSDAGADNLEVAGPDENAFAALADDDAIDYVTGGQGVDMIGIRFRITGASAPSCVAHQTRLSLCTADGDCTGGVVFAGENVPLATYVEQDGSRTTKTLWMLLDYPRPYDGERFLLQATVAGVSIERTLWLGERGVPPLTGLVGGQQSPGAIAVDAGYLYWANAAEVGTISRLPVGGGDVEVLAELQRRPVGLAADAERVYWINYDDGTVASVAKTGGAVTVHAIDQFLPGAVVVDDTHIYWTARESSRVMRIGKQDDSQLPEAVAIDQRDLGALAVDDTHIYWANLWDAAIVRRAKAGGEPEVIASGQGGTNSMVVDGDAVFWTNEFEGTIMRFDKTDRTSAQMYWGYLSPSALVADVEHVYFTSSRDGLVVQAAKDGSGEKFLASGQPSPHSVAIDDSAVYWTDTNAGAIFTVPKP